MTQQDDQRNVTQAWGAKAGPLATWAMTHLLNRDDAHGRYDLHDETRRASTVKSGVTHDLLAEHFAGRAVLALHTTSTRDTCRWLTVDVDNHGRGDAVAAANDEYARHLYDGLKARGFDPILEDSDGDGGRHITVLFREPVPARPLKDFGLGLVADWRAHGLADAPEVFPKQYSILNDGEAGFGNFVRLPGRHHKRDHWTRVWDGTAWLSGDDAVEALLRRSGDSPDLLSAAAVTPMHVPPTGTKPQAPPSKRQWWRQYKGDLKTLDVKGLFQFRNLLAAERPDGDYVVTCPWAAEHTTGDDTARIRAADPSLGLFPTFHCFHEHCTGRDFEAVLAFFGKPADDA